MRKCYILLGIFLTMALNGCSNIDNLIESKVWEESGILEDEKYIEYQNKIASRNIDEDGFYVPTKDALGSIHVTFAMNSNLNIRYFEDANKRTMIDTSSYYLNPGDTIYAEVDANKDISSMYEFSSFEIYEYNSTGDEKNKLDWSSDFNKTGIALQIPKTYEGTELSIVPIGKYSPRKISLRDYCSDDGGMEYDLSGTWMINDEEYTNDSVEINPLSSYIVSYQYDNNAYFYVSSEPECYYSNADDGMIIFKQGTATDKITDYSVKLCPYIVTSLVSGTDRTVKVNNEGMQNVKANTELVISKLKYGDDVIIETNKEWKELENINNDLICTQTELLADSSYKYTLNVPERGSEFQFDPSEYVYEHGSLTFQCFGSTVDTIQNLAKGSKIYYKEKAAEEGYWLGNGQHYITVGEEEETKRQLRDIHFIQKVQVSVHLKQPLYGGSIVYYVDGEETVSELVDTYSGTIITMDFKPWEGWICNSTNGTQYTVNETDSQLITINGTDVNNIFVEDNEHKPELTIILDKSVGKEMMFDISASGLEIDENSYQDAWYRSDYKIVDAQKIGTEENIVVSMKNKSIPTGEAIKLIVKKTDRHKDTAISEIRYVKDLTTLQEPICIYSDAERGNSEIWYRSIDVMISRVAVEQFTPYTASANTTITVKNEDTRQVMEEGDFIEKSQKVVVTIAPLAGYYIVDGNFSDNTSYQDSIKYSKYLSDMEKMISKHPAEKYCAVTLDESDTFAKYTYQCGKEAVSGSVNFRQGDKLTLEYEITDDSHKLKKSTGGFLGFAKSDKKVKKSIEITLDYDSKTLTKEDFGIEVTGGE